MEENNLADALRFFAILSMGPFAVVTALFITVWVVLTRKGDMKPDPEICGTAKDDKEWEEFWGIKPGMTYDELLAAKRR